MIVKIIERSRLAKVAAWKLKSDRVAMVIGKRIHLYGCTKAEFLRNEKWVRHEVAHVYQWLLFGRLRFLFLYLLESFNKGYYHNRFEVEARKKENDPNILDGVEVI